MGHFDGFIAEAGQVVSVPISGTDTATIVAAVSGCSIRVLSMMVTVTTATSVTLQDNTGTPVVLVGPSPVADNGGFVLPFNPYGHGQTGVGKLLSFAMGSGSAWGGVLTYQLIKST